MILLYRPALSPLADELEEALQKIVIAHRVVRVPDGESPAGVVLPAMRDGETWVTGERSLWDYVEDLARLMEDWDRYTSDSCFLERDGSIC